MKITAEMLPPGEEVAKARLPALRLPKARGLTLSAARAAFLFLCILGMIEGPEPWVRAALAVPFVLVVYAAGVADGRRSLALELLGNRRDDRRPRPAPPVGDEPEGE